MAGEIATNDSFQERMFNKIRDQMGDLLTDEELKKILENAVQKAFFQPRKETRGYNTYETDSLFVEMIREKMQSRVNESVDQWLKENNEKVGEILKGVIEQGMAACYERALISRMAGPFNALANDMQMRGIVSQNFSIW